MNPLQKPGAQEHLKNEKNIQRCDVAPGVHSSYLAK